MSISSLFTHSVTVQRLSHSNDNYGGESDTWADNLTAYKCRIFRPGGSSEIEDKGRTVNIIFNAIGENSDVLEGDKIVDGTDEYLVKQVYTVYGESTAHHKELELHKIA